MANEELLAMTLMVAVPLRIEELRERPVVEVLDVATARGKEWAEVIAGRADVMLYRGKKRGEAAEVFNVLSNALAHLAFVPGGVKFMGERWSAFPDGGLLLGEVRRCAWDETAWVSCLEWRAIDAMPTEETTTFFVPERGETWRHCGPEWGWRLAAKVRPRG